MSDCTSCPHNRIFFGSGGVYIFCRDCDASWTADDRGACKSSVIENYDRLPEPQAKHLQSMARGKHD